MMHDARHQRCSLLCGCHQPGKLITMKVTAWMDRQLEPWVSGVILCLPAKLESRNIGGGGHLHSTQDAHALLPVGYCQICHIACIVCTIIYQLKLPGQPAAEVGQLLTLQDAESPYSFITNAELSQHAGMQPTPGCRPIRAAPTATWEYPKGCLLQPSSSSRQ